MAGREGESESENGDGAERQMKRKRERVRSLSGSYPQRARGGVCAAPGAGVAAAAAGCCTRREYKVLFSKFMIVNKF